MSELERELRQLGRELDWPPTPDLAMAVSERLRAQAERVREPRRPRVDASAPARRRGFALLPPAGFRRSLAIAAIALLVLAGGVFAAVPSVRDSVLEFFGLQGATVERREQLPTPPKPGPLGLGGRTTLAAARDSIAFDPVLPAAAGEPAGVFVDTGVQGGVLSLTYPPAEGLPLARSTRLGLLVTEFRGDLLPEYTGKIAGQATRIERLRIDGDRALWLEGAPHLFFYRPPGEQFREENLRIAQNVLLLERGQVLVRLEGAFDREKAVELARSLR